MEFPLANFLNHRRASLWAIIIAEIYNRDIKNIYIKKECVKKVLRYIRLKYNGEKKKWLDVSSLDDWSPNFPIERSRSRHAGRKRKRHLFCYIVRAIINVAWDSRERKARIDLVVDRPRGSWSGTVVRAVCLAEIEKPCIAMRDLICNCQTTNVAVEQRLHMFLLTALFFSFPLFVRR